MALITPQQVIDIALTNKNTDQYLVKPAFVEIAELNFVQPSIGERLYEDISEEINSSTQWTWDNVLCTTTAGSYVVSLNVPVDHVAIYDFITSVDIPLYEDNGSTDAACCRGFNKVADITVVAGNVTSFKMSAAAKTTNAASLIKFRRPNGVLTEDYIKNYLAFCVKFEMMPDMSYNTTSQGVVENVADFTMPVDSKKLNFLRNETFKKSDTYVRKMTEFLDENSNAYPHYCNENKGGVSKLNGIILY
tara:strand:+ start:1486 stop:2229 length:744 start_codon:yes stop_codon:yes gene_type:complete